MPEKTKISYNMKKSRYFYIVVLICFLFLIFPGLFINKYLLPAISHPKSLIGNALVLLFTIFLGWCLIGSKSRKLLISGAALFLAAIFALSVFHSDATYQTDLSSVDALKTLPYVSWAPAGATIEKSGVTKYDSTRSCAGVNIYSSEFHSKAYIIDMLGNILHTWFWPPDTGNNVNQIELICDNGDLLVFTKGNTILLRMDRDSNIKWSIEDRFHHDLTVAENTDIYALGRKGEMVSISGIPIPIVNDYIYIISPEGEMRTEISLFEYFKSEFTYREALNVYRHILRYVLIFNSRGLQDLMKAKRSHFVCEEDTRCDILHNNTVEIIERDIDGVCKEGNVLLSVRNLDLIAILDIEKNDLVWRWGQGHISRQHNPTFLENGNILIFDNGCVKERSRILELDPVSKKIVWKYTADPPENFYSRIMGSNQRLHNGNTLITESVSGRVFEITRDGEVVWEFYNPEINVDKKERAVIYRMERIADPIRCPFLEEL